VRQSRRWLIIYIGTGSTVAVVLALLFFQVYGFWQSGKFIANQVLVRHASVQVNVTDENDEHYIGSGTEGTYRGQVYVLTAGHVAKGAETISVCGVDKVDRRAVVLALDEDIDLALLWVKGSPPSSDLPELDPVYPEDGEDCWYTTSGSGVSLWTEKATIGRAVYHGYDTLVTGQAWCGSSGGGVFVKRGNKLRLAGVIVRVKSDAPRAPTMCVGCFNIRKFLKESVLQGENSK
jgi:Trypsin-like peptidase domain